jgi:hypothetical protein
MEAPESVEKFAADAEDGSEFTAPKPWPAQEHEVSIGASSKSAT